jgi:DNA polymerase III subunit beta
MRITLHQEALQSILLDVQKAISPKPALPILQCVLLEATTQELRALGSDTHVTIFSTTACQVEESGKIAVPAKMLLEIVSQLPSGELTLSFQASTLTIQSRLTKTSIQCFDANDFPVIPPPPSAGVSIEAAALFPLIEQVAFVAGKDEARPLLTGIGLRFGERSEIVATDGYRLMVLKQPLAEVSDEFVILPARSLLELIRLGTRKKQKSIGLVIQEGAAQVYWLGDGWWMSLQRLEGEYPPYQKIIPEDTSMKCTFDASEFEQQLKLAQIFAKESSSIVKLRLSGDSMTLSAASSSLGTHESTLPIEMPAGGEIEVAFNIRYLLEFLQAVKPSRVWMGLNESLKPCVLRAEGNEAMTYVVMPIRPSGG